MNNPEFLKVEDSSQNDFQNQDLVSLMGLIVKKIRDQLPIQNPLPFFVHNNPIQHWETMSFKEGLLNACLTYTNAAYVENRAAVRKLEDFCIPMVARFLDQGVSLSLENLSDDFWVYYCEISKTKENWNSKKTLIDLMEQKNISIESWYDHIRSLAFHFKGWSGMVKVLESNPDLAYKRRVNVSLEKWLAVLISEETKVSKKNGPCFVLSKDKFKVEEQRYRNKISKLIEGESVLLKPTIEKISFHVSNLNKQISAETRSQAIFCIDDREESLRRILEKNHPTCETFGAVGFFGLDIKLKDSRESFFRSYCPPVVNPQKQIVARESFNQVKKFSHFFESFSNFSRLTFTEFFQSLISPFVHLPIMLLRGTNPKNYAKLKEKLLGPDHQKTTYVFEKEYSLEEKTDIVEKFLSACGLRKKLASVIFLVGHGATTVNNPFHSSYGCGACSGQTGIPNVKLFSSFANDERIQKALIERGFEWDTAPVFIPCIHDTCSDQIRIFSSFSEDDKLNQEVRAFHKAMNVSLAENAKLRFELFKQKNNEDPYHRSNDWSQVRPEFGHSGVKFAFFGPRWLTKDFDFKRESFLVSYDPDYDQGGSDLDYVINGALPVCANIALDYYTSSEFQECFGAGTKLSLNVVAGIGVMTGSKSDLRIGLANQMVDRHKGTRICAFVFSKKKNLKKIIDKSTRLTRLINNQWIHLFCIDPETFGIEAITNESNIFIS